MKYQPSLPQHNDNISAEAPLKDLVVTLAKVLVLAVAAYWLLGWAVDAAIDHLGPRQEAALYKAMAIEGPAPSSETAGKQAQVQALVDGLQQCAGLAAGARVHVIASDDVNAVVVPSGHVLVFTGLLDKVKSANGLSFVLAHELAHLKHRDHLRALGRGLVLYSISALLTGDASGVAELLAPAHQLGEASYSRGRESAADDTALRILHCRYGHAGGATEFFESLKKNDSTEARKSAGFSHYFASHPAMQERIDRLNQAIKEGGMRTLPVTALAN